MPAPRRRPPANRADQVALTDLIRTLRPDWPRWLVESVLQSHSQNVAMADLAIAALRYADDPSNGDARGIGWRGAHWRGLDTMPGQANQKVLCAVCMKPEDKCVTGRAGGFPADDPRADLHQFTPVGRHELPVTS